MAEKQYESADTDKPAAPDRPHLTEDEIIAGRYELEPAFLDDCA